MGLPVSQGRASADPSTSSTAAALRQLLFDFRVLLPPSPVSSSMELICSALHVAQCAASGRAMLQRTWAGIAASDDGDA